MVAKELSRMNDYFARYLLSKAGNEDLLLSFINAVMRDSGQGEFTSVTIRNPYNLKEHAAESETIVDVKATTSTGEEVIIEVQVKGNETFFDRVLEYWARNYRAERIKTKRGNKIKKFVPVISISILSFTLFDTIKFAHTSHMVHCVQNKKVTSDKLEIHFLELQKMHTLVKEDELKTWLTYFGSKNFERDKRMIAEKSTVFKKAVDDYDYFRSDRDLVSEYVKREVYLNGQSAMLEREFELGEEKGTRNTKIEIAKSLLNSGLSVHDVIKHTGLTKEQIKEL